MGAASPNCPLEERASHRAGLIDPGPDRRVDLFVDARDAAHQGRLDFLELLRKVVGAERDPRLPPVDDADEDLDRKSTRLNSSHSQISYAVFCLKKKISTLSST